jgi:hypothetical protein
MNNTPKPAPPKRSLSEICEELCPGVTARNAGAFTREPGVCAHGLKNCVSPMCAAPLAEPAQPTYAWPKVEIKQEGEPEDIVCQACQRPFTAEDVLGWTVVCPSCKGRSGDPYSHDPFDCPTCGGKGKVLAFPQVEAAYLASEPAQGEPQGLVAREAPEDAWIDCPDSQGWWWHWDGDYAHAPFIYSILTSLSRKINREFIACPDSRWCNDVGGKWMKIPQPAPPAKLAPSDDKEQQ